MLPRAFATAAVLVFFGACSCEEAPLIHQEPPTDLDTGVLPDTGAMEPDAGAEMDAGLADLGPADTGIPEGRVLRFIGTSPVALYWATHTTLRFELKTLSGATVPGETVRFSLSGLGSLGATSAVTDASGTAAVDITAANMNAQSTLTAEANLAAPVTVQLIVSEDPTASLVVDVSGTTRITLDHTELSVWIADPAATPSCATVLAAATLPAGASTGSFTVLPGSQTFVPVPSGKTVTALAIGKDRRGLRIATGCSEGTLLIGGTTVHVPVTISQLPTQTDGDYDVRLSLDLGSTIPPPVGPVIITITDVLSDPAGWAVYQTLGLFDDQFGSIFVEWTPPGQSTMRRATFDEVTTNPSHFPTWRAASVALDNLLTAQLGQTYTDFTNIGGDIAHLIRRFEVGARFTVTSTGVPGRSQVVESWRSMVFEWSQGCPAGDVGCARRVFDLTGAHANLAPVTATYGSSLAYAQLGAETERWKLSLDPHAIDVRYGAIVLVLLDELVFPSLPPNIAGHSLGEVLANVIGCADVATSISGSTGVPAALIQGICDAAVAGAAGYIENQILQLDSINNPGLIDGAGGGQLFLVDADHDLVTERVDDLETFASWSNGSAPPTTPIVGQGRRAASNCASDAVCTQGRVCAAIPSFLEVRALERDCRWPVGANPGGMSCTASTDCATGLCFQPAGMSGSLCFAACDPAAAASCAGHCTADAASMSLDPVRMGLGSAQTAACLP
ncbi:MAG: Ig-like domain-containing protein [Myxococcota bacterium]